MKNARPLLIAVIVVTGVLLLGGDVAQAVGGGGKPKEAESRVGD